MYRKALYLSLLIITGCTSIEKMDPHQEATFLKIYGETNNTLAKDLLVEDDGYVITGTAYDTATVIFKTDLQGNKIWATSIPVFTAEGITKVEDGYILLGNSITDSDTTFMKLFKVDFSGNTLADDSLRIPAPCIARAVTYTSANEVVVVGYGSFGNSYTSTVVMGYNSDLTEKWNQPRYFGVSGFTRVPYRSVYETNIGNNIVWLNFSYQNGVAESENSIEASFVAPDSDIPYASPFLLNGNKINVTASDFIKLPVGYALAQTIENTNQEFKIGVSIFDQSSQPLDENIIDITGNYQPTSLANTPNGILIAGLTNQYKDGGSDTRTDPDLFVIEVDYNGSIKPNGINNSFGGLGQENPVRVRNAPDGGYLILGDLGNTKGAIQIFLLKINSKGELN